MDPTQTQQPKFDRGCAPSATPARPSIAGRPAITTRVDREFGAYVGRVLINGLITSFRTPYTTEARAVQLAQQHIQRLREGGLS